MIPFRKVWGEHHDRGKVELAISNLLKDNRKLSSDSGSAGSAKGSVLRETQLVDTVHVEARARAEPMDAPRLDFGEMSQEVREQLVGAPHQTTCAGQQVSIRDLIETVGCLGA